MTIVRIILGLILTLIWTAGAILPVLPGPLLNYIALLILQFTGGHPFSTEFLILRWGVIVLVTILDYVIPVIWTKKFWWTKWWVTWSTIWLIIAVIILPILWISIGPFGILGLIAWPFLGAYLGEKMAGGKHAHALKSAFWSFLWFAAGTILKLVVCIVMGLYFVIESFKIIKATF